MKEPALTRAPRHFERVKDEPYDAKVVLPPSQRLRRKKILKISSELKAPGVVDPFSPKNAPLDHLILRQLSGWRS
jgi:hypothetical protein